MKFTKTEWEIIKHRLGVSDCIWEAVYMDDDSSTVTDMDVHRRCRELYDVEPGTEIDMEDELTSDIIHDCCDGSTFFCAMDFDRLADARYTKAAYSLERKLNVSIPLC